MSQRLTSIQNILTSGSRMQQLRKSSKLSLKQLHQTMFPQHLRKYIPQVFQMMADNPLVFSHNDIEDIERPEQRQKGAKQLIMTLKKLKLNSEQTPYRFEAIFYAMSCFRIESSVRSLVHYMLYMKSLLIFENNQFHRQCIQDGHQGKDLGCFALTEFYHGSYSRGIQTQAIYDKQNKQFVITTQGEKGMKFWIGNAWLTATMTILWANLIIDGTSYGPHPFILRLRQRNTHQVMPGVTLLDCGPKNGLNLVDNGGIRLENVRIPYQNLLSKLGKIDQHGNYVSPIKSNLQRFGRHMSPLSAGRALITLASFGLCLSGLAIAFRYVTQRRQFKDPKSQEPQTLLIDYPLTKFRLIPCLAQTFVYGFGGVKLSSLYTQNIKNFMNPTKEIVSELHAISAVCKSKSTTFGNSLMSICRQMLGGHGYSSFSRLGDLYQANDVNSTWQGDNNLLLQQTSKFLLKFISKRQKGQLIDLDFVNSTDKQQLFDSKQSLQSLENLKKILQTIFTEKYQRTIKQIAKLKAEKSKDAWNQLQPFFANELALSFGDLYYFGQAYKNIKQLNGSQYNRKFLEQCLRTWSHTIVLKQKFGSIQIRKIVQALVIEGCDLLYPDCISAIDAVAPPSSIIGSPFARQDGQGMKQYINMFMTGRNTFQIKPWASQFISLRDKI